MSDNLINTCLSLEKVANGEIVGEEQINHTKNQIRIFLIAQAQRELIRVVKLTDMLDKLQERYIDKATEYMDDHDDANSSVLYIPSMIETITKSLEASSKIISQVAGNDKVMNFQIISNTDNSVNCMSLNNNSVDLKDPKSRLKVRETITAILNNIQSPNKEVIVDDTANN